MPRLRTLLLLPSLIGGGAERVMMYLARGLPRDRFELTLGIGDPHGPYVPLLPRDIEIISFGATRMAATVPRLTWLLATRRFDVCYSMMAMNMAAVVARELARSTTPLVLGARGHYSVILQAEQRAGRLRLELVRRLYPRAERVVAVSRGVADDLVQNLGLSRERTLAIPNPVDLERIRAESAKDPGHPWLSPSETVPVLVHVGALKAAKGHAQLLEAFARVRAHRPVRLLLVGGDGGLEQAVRAKVRELGVTEDVGFVGFQDNPYQFMSRATVFVLSSLWEGFPNVVAEAMACGAPVVSFDCDSGPREIVRDGVSGVLVPVGDAAQLAGAIERVLADPELRASLRREALRDVERFSLPTVIERYAAVLEEVAANGLRARARPGVRFRLNLPAGTCNVPPGSRWGHGFPEEGFMAAAART